MTISPFSKLLPCNSYEFCPPLLQVRPHGTTPYCSDLLTDGGCVALLVVGFLLVTPLLVLALAAYCRLARHLQLGLCFIPYSRAVYKNLPAARHRGLGTGCCGSRDGVNGSGKGKVWVWDEVWRKEGRGTLIKYEGNATAIQEVCRRTVWAWKINEFT